MTEHSSGNAKDKTTQSWGGEITEKQKVNKL